MKTLPIITVHTSSGPHSFNASTKWAEVFVTGGGGGGGKESTDTYTITGGGAGGTAISNIIVATGTASIVVGNGGAASGGNTGSAGASSSFIYGAYSLTGGGGPGGGGQYTVGGVASGGEINISGGDGSRAAARNENTNASGFSTVAGSFWGSSATSYGSVWGGGGVGTDRNTNALSGNAGVVVIIEHIDTSAPHKTTVYTATGADTHTFDVKTKAFKAYVTGGGGGGGRSGNNIQCASGGSAGGTAIAFGLIEQADASLVVGGGGARGPGNNNGGSVGGTSSVAHGSFSASSPGGGGGAGNQDPGAETTPVSGGLNIPGGSGIGSNARAVGSEAHGRPGAGYWGSYINGWGGGGRGTMQNAANNLNGTAGVVIIEEYI